MHPVHDVARRGREGDVHLALSGVDQRSEPETGEAVGPTEPHDKALVDREAHHLVHPQAGEGRQVEAR